MSSAFVFDGLRMHLKARGMTYADVARALKISEATVKRIFATKSCTLERLDSICDLVQVDLAELARGAPPPHKHNNRRKPPRAAPPGPHGTRALQAVASASHSKVTRT